MNLSKAQWEYIGRKAGWTKTSQDISGNYSFADLMDVADEIESYAKNISDIGRKGFNTFGLEASITNLDSKDLERVKLCKSLLIEQIGKLP